MLRQPNPTGTSGRQSLRNNLCSPKIPIPTVPVNTLARKPPFAMGPVPFMKQSQQHQKPQSPKMQVISCPEVGQAEEQAIIGLYEALVPEALDRPIDIGLIKNEGFPAFARTIGDNRFSRLKTYFGIGCSPDKKSMSETKKKDLIGKLKTIENAQFYISGYKELLQNVAVKLDGAPEEMDVIARAKFVRMFVTLFCCYGFFPQDIENEALNVSKAIKNNKKLFTPEELFEEYELKIKHYPDKAIICEQVAFELALHEESVFDQALQFAELKVSADGKYFVSVNETIANQTFYSVRELKNRINSENGGYSVETFSIKPRIEQLYVDTLYTIYKLLRTVPLEYFGKEERKVQLIENSALRIKSHTFYKLGPEISIGGPLERARFINLLNFVAQKGYILKKEDGTTVDVGLLSAAIKFANESGFVGWNNSARLDLRVAEAIMARDQSGEHLLKYKNQEIDTETLKTLLQIGSEFEKEVRAIKKELGIITLEDVAVDFAVANHYVDSAEQVNKDLVKNVILPRNEQAFQEYESGKIDETTLKKRICFEGEFAEMYFDPSKVDIPAIETHLLELKRGCRSKKGEEMMKKSALLIALYCYLVKNKIPCGPKNKVPKGNSSLRIKNLLQLIA